MVRADARCPWVLWRDDPGDPFDELGADLVLEAMHNGPLPPEAYKDSDDLAAEQLVASVEIVETVMARGIEAVYGPEPEFGPPRLSKYQEVAMSIVAAIIDQREPEWVRRLTFGGATVATSLLDAGDLLATCDDGTLLAIERKTPDDLLNSIREDRLWSQLTGIRALSRWAYLMITGGLWTGPDGKVVADGRATGWSWAAIQGALLQAQEMGIFVVFATSDDDYEAAVLRLAARSHRSEMLISPAREPRILSAAEQILCSLPGIGLERVQALVEHCSSPAWALSYLTCLTTSDPIPGIGPGIRRAIRKVLGLGDDQELAVVIAETGQLAKESGT